MTEQATLCTFDQDQLNVLKDCFRQVRRGQQLRIARAFENKFHFIGKDGKLMGGTTKNAGTVDALISNQGGQGKTKSKYESNRDMTKSPYDLSDFLYLALRRKSDGRQCILNMQSIEEDRISYGKHVLANRISISTVDKYTDSQITNGTVVSLITAFDFLQPDNQSPTNLVRATNAFLNSPLPKHLKKIARDEFSSDLKQSLSTIVRDLVEKYPDWFCRQYLVSYKNEIHFCHLSE
ncbi:MAG: CIA30 family protein [Actinomycetia bacterium]|nr:CIA30 family protein [Actinomycetes bacterium]